MAEAPRDQNHVTSVLFESSTNAGLTIAVKGDQLTGRMFVDIPSGSGTVTSVSVVTANGFAGSVATATTTPAITLSTTITGILSGNGTAISAATTTGSGSVVLATSPTLVTPLLGSPTSGNLVNCTGYTVANLAGLGTGIGTFLATPSSANLLAAMTDKTGTGVLVFATTPTLVTPVLGVATATSINKVAITAPASSATLTIADGKTVTHNTTTTFAGTDGKTLTINNSLTLTGTDSTTMTFPATTATIARTDAAQTFTGTQTFSQTILTANAITASSNAATVPVTSGRNIVTNNSAATLTITLTTASAVNMQTCIVQVLDFSAVAQTITWVNTENSTISVPATSNGSTSLPLSVGFIYNGSTSKWRCVASA
jgi:hypothetical protein